MKVGHVVACMGFGSNWRFLGHWMMHNCKTVSLSSSENILCYHFDPAYRYTDQIRGLANPRLPGRNSLLSYHSGEYQEIGRRSSRRFLKEHFIVHLGHYNLISLQQNCDQRGT